MLNINNYIIEKLHINKDTKLIKIIDIDNPQCWEDIFICTTIVCLREHYYKKTATGFHKIRGLDLHPIMDLLKSIFGYHVESEDIQYKKGAIWTIVSKNIEWIEALMNGKYFSKFWWEGKDRQKANEDLNGKDIKEKYKKYITGELK
jgi:hypothetical protein